MYIQITTKCNMNCAHCGLSCGTKGGSHMSMKVFKKTLQLATQYCDFITLGGGEPTLHPNFAEIFGLTILYNKSGSDPLIITNGTDEDITLALLSCNKIYCEVSLDDGYHDGSMVSDAVKQAARANKKVRRVLNISKTGRGKHISGAKEICVCEDIFITSAGDIYMCGCKKTKLGNVMDPNLDMDGLYELRVEKSCERGW